MLHIELADKDGLKWAQEMVMCHHYLHKPVDVRCSLISYLVKLEEQRVGCLIFGRPENTRVNGWYGSLEDVASGKCRLSRWQVLNLARIWLHPSLQHGGECYIENAATWVIGQALHHINYDYLMKKPPVWMNEPYEIREILSYCDTRIHQGTLYKASNFRLMRTNEHGIETYMRLIRRHLTHAERAEIAQQSSMDKRCRSLRVKRAQLPLFEEGIA